VWSTVSVNIVTKVISVVIAIVLWIIVLGSRNVEVTKEIPLEVITPADIVPANEIPEKIAFRLSGPKAFLRAILDRREVPIRVDLSGAKPGLVTYRFFQDNIRVPIGVKVLSINPAAILIKLEHLKRRDVPVRPVLRGVPPDGYRIVSTSIKPELIRIKGAESRVDSAQEVPTAPVDVSSMRQTVEREVALDIGHGNFQLEGTLPKIHVEIEPVSANFKIKNVDVRVIAGLKSHVDEKSVTVLVRAEPGDLKNLDRTRLYAEVDLTGKPKGQYLETVKVTLPKNIGLVKVVPSRVNVTLY
jgi:YbbR domain-containing protein